MHRSVGAPSFRHSCLPVTSIPADEAAAHFGGLAFTVGTDLSASSLITRQRLGWEPTSPETLLDDLARSSAYAA